MTRPGRVLTDIDAWSLLLLWTGTPPTQPIQTQHKIQGGREEEEEEEEEEEKKKTSVEINRQEDVIFRSVMHS